MAGTAVNIKRQAAGLGAGASVSAAAAEHRAEIALSGHTHAQSAVNEYFKLYRAVFCDIGNFIPAQLSRKYCALEAHPVQQLNAL